MVLDIGSETFLILESELVNSSPDSDNVFYLHSIYFLPSAKNPFFFLIPQMLWVQ